VGDLLVRNVPDAVKQDLLARAQRSGRSLSDETKHIIFRGLAAAKDEPEQNSGADFTRDLLKLFSDVPVEEKEQFSAIMDEIEEQRKKDLGRPFSFEE
jgi:plasmid stability protein